jgi:hypothetical protein
MFIEIGDEQREVNNLCLKQRTNYFKSLFWYVLFVQ